MYGGLSLNGIRGQRTEVQAADDVILGILAEHAIKNLMEKKFKTRIKLDEEVHPEHITPQDFDQIEKNGKFRAPRLGVGIKASKMKNAYLVLGQILLNAQQFNQAVELLDQTAKNFPNNGAVFYMLSIANQILMLIQLFY